MTNTPKYLVDGLLSLTTHNGVHRLIFYELAGADSPQARPYVELAIPAPVMHSIVETITSMPNGAAPIDSPVKPVHVPHP
jgi:hypothetical protein